MRFNNPFEANDWNIKELLVAVLGILLALWLLVALDSFGIDVPIVRQLVGIVYVLFLPGVLLLRILRLHKLGSVETLLYTVGLSLAFNMAVGLLLTAAGALNLISRPISLLPLLISISAAIFALSWLAYRRDKNFDDPKLVLPTDPSLQWSLFLALLPFVCVFGTYLMNDYGSNALLLALYVSVGLSMLYIAFSTKFPKELYPLAIFVIALVMLFSTSLISQYISGWDIQFEYYEAALVVHNGAWDWTAPGLFNSMLSVVMIPPTVSILAKLDLAVVFKAVYALLFALMPVGLYAVFKRLTDEKIAFLSAFFVICSFTFFIDLPQLARQEIGELFLALILLLFVSYEIKGTVKTVLLLIFSFSLIVSCFALAIVYIGIFVAAACGLYIINYRKALSRGRKAQKTDRSKQSDDVVSSERDRSETLSLRFVLLLIIVASIWYSLVAGGIIGSTLAQTAQNFVSRFATDVGVPSSTGASSAVATVGLLHNAATGLRLLFECFIVIGLSVTILMRRGLSVTILMRRSFRNNTYLCLAVAALALLAAAAFLPNVASILNFTRFYHIALLTLAPFCIVGGIFAVSTVQKYLPLRKPSRASSIRVVAVLLFVSLLFESNAIYQVVEHSSGNFALDNQLDWPAFNTREVTAANWWYTTKDNNSFIYADVLRQLLLNSLDGTEMGSAAGQFTGGNHVRELVVGGGGSPQYSYAVDVNATGSNSYVFLGTKNIDSNKLAMQVANGYVYVNQSSVLSGRGEIYDNGGAQIYFG
jgi:uncharacterized membrane protein